MPVKALSRVVGLIIIFLRKENLEDYKTAVKFREYREEMKGM